jgi:hypothetical protein
VKFVGVAALDTEDAMLGFVGATGVDVFPNINDEEGQIWARYGIGYQPAFVLIRADGMSETYASLAESELQGHIDRLF